MKHFVPVRDVRGPCEEEVGDDAERRTAVFSSYVNDELVEGGKEGFGGDEESNFLVVGYSGEVLGVRMEAVGGGVEGDGSKTDGREEWGREGGATDGLDVETGVDEGNGEGGVVADEMAGEGEEGCDVARSHEGKENHMLTLDALH